jgi:hypothetical protein
MSGLKHQEGFLSFVSPKPGNFQRFEIWDYFEMQLSIGVHPDLKQGYAV